MADPPRFEHGLQAPQAQVISRLHYGSNVCCTNWFGLTPSVDSDYSANEYRRFPVELSKRQSTSFTYRGMKNPTFLGVKPWFLIRKSILRCATIWLAVHSGFDRMYCRISRFNRSSLACFWLPMDIFGTESIWRSSGETRGPTIRVTKTQFLGRNFQWQ